MENNHNGGTANENAGLQNNAYDTENTIGQENNFDVPAEEIDDIESGTNRSDRDDEDKDNGDLEEDDDTENDEPKISDWGDYDPLNNGMPSENDPAAPGSAV